MFGDGRVVRLVGELWRLCDLFCGGSFFSIPFVTDETPSRHPIILSSYHPTIS
jgi:hypothetical protein